jgi:hypothetical protein
MSNLLMVEQTAMTVQASGQQTLYPKAGAMARMDSTGVEKLLLDTGSYAQAISTMDAQFNFQGL